MTHTDLTHLDEAPAGPTSIDLWASAREDYLSGDTAAAVAERHGVSVRTVRRRAAVEGWRRADLGPPEPHMLTGAPASLDELIAANPELAPIADQNADDAIALLICPRPDDLARIAFRRAAEAAAGRKPAQAAAWLRVIALLDRCDDRLRREYSPVNADDWLRSAAVRAYGALLADEADAREAAAVR